MTYLADIFPVDLFQSTYLQLLRFPTVNVSDIYLVLSLRPVSLDTSSSSRRLPGWLEGSSCIHLRFILLMLLEFFLPGAILVLSTVSACLSTFTTPKSLAHTTYSNKSVSVTGLDSYICIFCNIMYHCSI